jgi:antitoxin component of RelBE/YafQ-DinJ toxin-antitoxin module
MTEKELISVRLETDTKQRVEEYADKHGVSRSVAIRRLLDKGMNLEEMGIAVAASDKTERTIPDGGQLDETQNQVEEVSEEVSSVSEEVSAVSEQIQAVMLPLSVAILWIAIQTTVGFPLPPFGTALTGIPVVLWLAYVQLREILQ